MSDTTPTESPPKSQLLANDPDLLRDIVLWRRSKYQNILLLSALTSAWTSMEIYQFNFITLLSCVAIAIVLLLFLWGNVYCLLKKKAPGLYGVEISEQTTVEIANIIRRRVEEGIRMIFHVSCEREWFEFTGVVISLYLLSLVASCLDFLTVCYVGVVGLMSLPVIYVKNESKIIELEKQLRMRSQKLSATIEDRLKKLKDKITAGKRKDVKDKKTK